MFFFVDRMRRGDGKGITPLEIHYPIERREEVVKALGSSPWKDVPLTAYKHGGKHQEAHLLARAERRKVEKFSSLEELISWLVTITSE